ncbi:MAG: DUF554 domain-containing protein [Firmicutes bacterium]|jgi:hypothetical protein|uniref:DUF554 domain-containing protein n=1 Tax=Sulfobacillus benefaciens TaxID=453960 RepID=A0A2T2WU01_9FIRM|nr:DUF554 domain-containing protein [Bacillota bacterium]MCL5012732.1 DUF554 domain-containing protein [Bacillota bacterium]PSR25717.1 MAG: DUF554 domain-containing protein [Sulfobacillus benefaciens]HBQ96401.1 DUF554 domain-containing protein [Sulfobacillus sp.]
MQHIAGALINGLGIVLGSLIGLVGGRRFSTDFRQQALRVIGIVVILIGFKMAWPLPDPINTLLSLELGLGLGTWLHIEDRIEQFGRWAESRVGTAGFSKGFIAGTLIFNIGAMSILGSLQNGLTGRFTILATKAVLDGTTAIILTSVAGWGVIAASVVTALYEGSLSLLASDLAPVLRGVLLTDITAVGGLMIAAIGINFVFENGTIKIGNLLPALIFPILLLWLKTHGLYFL